MRQIRRKPACQRSSRQILQPAQALRQAQSAARPSACRLDSRSGCNSASLASTPVEHPSPQKGEEMTNLRVSAFLVTVAMAFVAFSGSEAQAGRRCCRGGGWGRCNSCGGGWSGHGGCGSFGGGCGSSGACGAYGGCGGGSCGTGSCGSGSCGGGACSAPVATCGAPSASCAMGGASYGPAGACCDASGQYGQYGAPGTIPHSAGYGPRDATEPFDPNQPGVNRGVVPGYDPNNPNDDPNNPNQPRSGGTFTAPRPGVGVDADGQIDTNIPNNTTPNAGVNRSDNLPSTQPNTGVNARTGANVDAGASTNVNPGAAAGAGVNGTGGTGAGAGTGGAAGAAGTGTGGVGAGTGGAGAGAGTGAAGGTGGGQ